PRSAYYAVAAGTGSDRPSSADAAARIASSGAHIAVRRPRPIGRPRPFTLEPGLHWRGIDADRTGAVISAIWPLRAASCNCGGACGGAQRLRHELDADRRVVR